MIYMISFDPHKGDATALHNVIENSQLLINWWHYIGSTYLVKSNYGARTIQDEIAEKWPQQRFLVIKVDPTSYGGWLPQKSWHWIARQA